MSKEIDHLPAIFTGERLSYLRNAHPRYIEELFHRYQADPASVHESWRLFFEGVEFAAVPAAAPGSGGAVSSATPAISPAAAGFDPREFKVIDLIQAYRSRGHLFTRTNPVRTRRPYRPTLETANFGLGETDLDAVFQAGAGLGLGPATLREIIAHLEETYCRSIGAEYMYIRVPERVEWLQRRMESTRNRPDFSPGEQRRILETLSRAVVFENFLHSRYPGQKRFALSGGETLIPGLVAAIEAGAGLGIEEFVIGMAHRGRLNVLANVLGKPYLDIFEEFEGMIVEEDSLVGDVKYHLGFANTIRTSAGQEIRLTLSANPSHLEAVGPVVEGMARARIDTAYAGNENRLAPIVIHGDAAIAGQGVVYEVIQMSLLDGYRTGGTIHLVINNQLGFTTNYLEGRSSTYCTDAGKVTLSPVFHVNADDVEAVVLAVRTAVEFRQTFHTDVFIDLLGYRRYGHNESDEPRFTQPKLYQIIARHPDPRTIYNRQLLDSGRIAAGAAEEMERVFRDELQRQLTVAREDNAPHCHYIGRCDRRFKPDETSFCGIMPTGVERDRLRGIGERIFTIPDGLAVFDKIRRLYTDWRANLLQRERCDWAMAEHLAYGTILADGTNVRISGQDCERGTFSHRHAVLRVERSEETYVPLRQAAPGQGSFRIVNSLLSEYAVMGFEYGYASAHPEGLTIWEAQFGDFASGAQIIIDEYLVAAEAKWNRLNGLVLLLPHGYEGQGSDHSSARLERFLAMCAGNNQQVVNATTPANLFHVLRRHMRFPVRIPLVIFTPKSLLRHPRCVSPVEEFCQGGFLPVIGDPVVPPKDVRRVLLCSGKLFYELLEHRETERVMDTAIVRLEQLYPLPAARLREILAGYPGARTVRWVQEEPGNMGAASFLRQQLASMSLEIVSRKESAAPATGFHQIHHQEQTEIIQKAFAWE